MLFLLSQSLLLLLLLLLHIAHAQYPPKSNLTTITSPVDGNITISYKSPPKDTCKTAFENQQQYTGWVHIPGNYSTNLFFWFIEARAPTNQLTIWLNGGPGSSSMVGLFTGNGPCEVVQLGANKLGTVIRQWGWDRGSNMLYIDQPNQVGFSYDRPTNGSIDLLTSELYTPPQSAPDSQPAETFLDGTFSSLNGKNTANTTEISAMAVWHMLQGFLGAFPQYRPNNSDSMGVHLFAESYGGRYGPAFASLWKEQNARRLNGSLPLNGTLEISLASLGIVNGCVDDLIQAPFYPVMAVNNTYGLAAISPTRADLARRSFDAPGGCKTLIENCRAAVAAEDPRDNGNVPDVNNACAIAFSTCSARVLEPYMDAGRSVYDIAHYLPESFPSSLYLEYLNTPEFLSAIGSPVNFTQTNSQALQAFTATGDYERNSYVSDIAFLLNAGIRVGLIYGDRDYICNWFGGEAISLAIAAATSPDYAARFPAAGYAPIITNDTYIGGVVRQYGNLSFSRIFDAGHAVPAYQPETSFEVFARIMRGTSLSTGEFINLSTFNTTGPLDSTQKNDLPPSPAATCWVRNIPGTCNAAQKNKILQNEGVVINGIHYDAASDANSFTSTAWSSSSNSGGNEVSTTTTTQVLTGFYTATATPSTTQRKSVSTRTNTNIFLLVFSFLATLASSLLS